MESARKSFPRALKFSRKPDESSASPTKPTDYPFGGEHYLATKQTLPDAALKELAAHDAILFGAVGVDPRGSAQIPQGILETEILLKMRFELDQYINLRPTRLLPGVPTPLKNVKPQDVDMVIVRENTEGLYAQNGGFLYKGTPHEVANQIEVTTRHGVERAIRYAFEYAKQFGRKKVTLVAKTNVLRFAHNLWLRAFEESQGGISRPETDYHHVDACTMYMVTKPKIYDVIVTTNMFGDIITDLGAAIQGGMGMAASGNLNPTAQNRQHVRAGARQRPDIAGKNWANPIATFLVGRDDARFPRPAAGGQVDQGRVCKGRRRHEKPHPRPGRHRHDDAGRRCRGGGDGIE